MLAKSLSFSCAKLSMALLVGGRGYEGSGAVREDPFFSLYHHHIDRAWLRPTERPLRAQTPIFHWEGVGRLPVSLCSPGGVLIQLPLQAVSS